MSGKTTTGQGVIAVNGRGFASLVFQYSTSAGTATVRMEYSCDGGTTWAIVANSSKALDVNATASDGIGVNNPTCLYLPNVTASSSGNVTVRYSAGVTSGQ